jgi:GH15 family glucan-1,4-alpha-glucosidase
MADTDMYKSIGDYGIIGNLHSIALVGLDGSIDWCCLPYLDSPSVFGALLDERKGGHFSIRPTGEWDSVASYLATTNILVTSFRTRTGVMALTDFMPIISGEFETEQSKRPEIYRMVQITEGEMEVRAEFFPRFDYARAETNLQDYEFGLLAEGGAHSLALCCSVPDFRILEDKAVASWQLSKGDFIWFHLHFDQGECRRLEPDAGGRALKDTEAFWHKWLKTRTAGYGLDLGPFKEMVERSALVLKLLQFRPTGAIAAAATTSLPEAIGGMRNWDYRFSWVRDSSLTLDALFSLGHLEEAEQYLLWIGRLIREKGFRLQVLYDLQGQEEALTEIELEHLDGYKGSRPVRIGNAAAGQRQLDIYGEIMDAAMKLSRYVGKVDYDYWPVLRNICQTVLSSWREKDLGIWEVRGAPQHFVYSKAMCWVALDRGIAIARRFGFPADIATWEATREEIHRDVLEKGWNKEKKSFVPHYETDALDASCLLLSIFGFLPFKDPRMTATTEAVLRDLSHDGFIHRYRLHQTDDGLQGDEGVFLVCSFWAIQNLIGQGKLDQAERMLLKMERMANHLGLFAEEYDLRWKVSLGNFPQALTHIGFINSVVALCRARARGERMQGTRSNIHLFIKKKLLFASDFVLNEGEPQKRTGNQATAHRLRKLMNMLQGAFFETATGRIAYEKMASSALFQEYHQCSLALQNMDLAILKGRSRQLAFWINLYNVIVLHGVVELRIRHSVREVPRFFRRIRYRIGTQEFSPDDIEHGILRANHRLPNSLFRPFGRKDPRRRWVIERPDPRIHFALVCAARSCPPIAVYEADRLDDQLEVSGRTFINSGGAEVDRSRGLVRLSQVFRWYGEDFAKSREELLHFVAGYLYNEKDRAFLQNKADRIKIEYFDYDWRLNRI